MLPGVGHLAQKEDAIGTVAVFERFLTAPDASSPPDNRREGC